MRLPTVEDATRPPASAKGRRLRFSAEMVAVYVRGLREGPLARHLGEGLAAHLRDGTLTDGIRRTSMHRAAMAVTAFQLWAERDDSVLRPIDPAELLEERTGR